MGYYKVHEEQLSWEEAKGACEAEDAHLLILNSEAEAAAVQQLIKLHPNVNSWVHAGFHDKGKEGSYVTIFGEPLASTGFTRWNTNQPDNAGNNENCGSIHAATMGLNDLPCTTYRTPFVCEQFM
ncbi:hypothetical protein R5R35_006224 [Gryllus longicercus]|uniref:C-type lectin domain-containing protein n=1 Tax=Gryllus longicercus TaxID=2509291 RepID=A0AAN9W0Z2_9ORTH